MRYAATLVYMQNTDRSTQPSRVPGIPRKPLDNPQPAKPTYSSDVENARLLESVLRRLPAHLDTRGSERFPLLDAVMRHDARTGQDFARPLVFIAAETHAEADERRTAEYMLRHRLDVIADRRSALGLLLSARCAAEMDVRRIFGRETPTPSDSIPLRPAASQKARLDDPSVGETVLSYLHRVTGHLPATYLAHERILDAVTIAVELSKRHALNNGKGPSLIAMRPAVRAQSRLVTHLRTAFGDGVAARSLARLLVGGDGSPIETSLLWWAAHPDASPDAIPSSLRRRWVRDLWDADPSVRGCETHQRRTRAPVPAVRSETLDLRLA